MKKTKENRYESVAEETQPSINAHRGSMAKPETRAINAKARNPMTFSENRKTEEIELNKHGMTSSNEGLVGSKSTHGPRTGKSTTAAKNAAIALIEGYGEQN
jgi:hypothetical protein